MVERVSIGDALSSATRSKAKVANIALLLGEQCVIVIRSPPMFRADGYASFFQATSCSSSATSSSSELSMAPACDKKSCLSGAP